MSMWNWCLKQKDRFVGTRYEMQVIADMRKGIGYVILIEGSFARNQLTVRIDRAERPVANPCYLGSTSAQRWHSTDQVIALVSGFLSRDKGLTEEQRAEKIAHFKKTAYAHGWRDRPPMPRLPEGAGSYKPPVFVAYARPPQV